MPPWPRPGMKELEKVNENITKQINSILFLFFSTKKLGKTDLQG